MASRIAGITVEIGGDTTKLSKALESVNKTIKTTQSELKDVNKLLKLDPSNTETVTQKQRMLKDAIEATKEKLTTLKTAAEQANQQLADGKITQEQYDALQRDIVETEQNLKSLQEQAAVTNVTLAKIDAVGEKLQTVGSQVESVGKKFLPVTAAVTGLGTAAVKTAADFDQEMSKVSAISGATGDDFDQLRAKAREMGGKTKFSASEAASAMEYMAMAGWKTGDMLDGIEGIMNLAAASGEDLATTSDIVTDALTAFGLSASDSGHFADILAAASSNANTNVSMMGETFKYCAPIAGALGFSAEDTAEAIGLMANSGIKASQAGTSLRSIMNNLAGEVTFAGKNIGEVTIATSNADGSMRSLNDILADCRVAFSGLTESEKAANAESLVGKNAMSGFLALMNSGEGDINKLRGAIENCDGSAESMAETMQDNLNGQLTILKSQLEELAISFGDLLMPTIRKIVSAVQAFVDKLNSMDDSTRETILKVAALAAAIGPLLIVLGKTISTAGTALKGFSSLANAFNAGSLAKSTFAWKNSPDGFFISTDGGKTWGYGWERDDSPVKTALLLENTLQELDERYKKAGELTEELLEQLDERYKTASALSEELIKSLDARYGTADKLSEVLLAQLDERYKTASALSEELIKNLDERYGTADILHVYVVEGKLSQTDMLAFAQEKEEEPEEDIGFPYESIAAHGIRTASTRCSVSCISRRRATAISAASPSRRVRL